MTVYQLGVVFGWFVGPLLIFGTLFWLIKRGRLTVLDAVQNRWVLGLTVLTVVANAMVNGLPSHGAGRGSVFKDDAERLTFYRGCIKGAVSRMEQSAAERACACVADEVKVKLTREQFVTMNRVMSKGGDASPEMVAIANRCDPPAR
jgi:cytochrome P450